MNDLVMPALRVGHAGRELPKLPEIPRGRYTDEAFYRTELKHVFGRTWLHAGHVSEFRKAGSYRTLDLPPGPIVIVKGNDGQLRAFLNTCRHRGARLVHEEEGCARRLSCRYHGWTWDLAGKLMGLPGREGFGGGLKLEDYPLVSVRCELWGGFVFVNFDRNAPALMDWLAPSARRFDAMAKAPVRIVAKNTWDMECNWKILVDAFRESYHIPMVHAKTAALAVDGYDGSYEMYPNGGGTMLFPYNKDFAQSDFSGLPLNETSLRRLPGTEDRLYSETTVLATFFPNLDIGFQPMGFPLVAMWPTAVNRSRMEIHWYGMDWGNEPKPTIWDKIVADFAAVTEEDIANLVGIQSALEASADLGIPLCTLECLVYQLHVEIDKAIGPENVPAHLRVPDVLGDFLVS